MTESYKHNVAICERVSDCSLLAGEQFFLADLGENKLDFDEMMIMSTLY